MQFAIAICLKIPTIRTTRNRLKPQNNDTNIRFFIMNPPLLNSVEKIYTDITKLYYDLTLNAID